VREHPGAVEADLQRFYGVDYRDRWHPDRRYRLTLRRIYVLVAKYPPLDGNVARILNDGQTPWRLEHHLLDDIRIVIEAVMTDKKHTPKPAANRPTGRAAERRRRDSPERRRKLTDARRRARERARAKAAGELA
jgi:hypothetical protein